MPLKTAQYNTFVLTISTLLGLAYAGVFLWVETMGYFTAILLFIILGIVWSNINRIVSEFIKNHWIVLQLVVRGFLEPIVLAIILYVILLCANSLLFPREQDPAGPVFSALIFSMLVGIFLALVNILLVIISRIRKS